MLVEDAFAARFNTSFVVDRTGPVSAIATPAKRPAAVLLPPLPRSLGKHSGGQKVHHENFKAPRSQFGSIAVPAARPSQ